MMKAFTVAGTYVAVLNTTNFDGYYARVFEYPGEKALVGGGDAAWFYLNRIDLFGCLEAVFPLEVFSKIMDEKNICQCAWCKKVRIGENWFTVDKPEQLPHAMSHGGCPTCLEKFRAEYHQYRDSKALA